MQGCLAHPCMEVCPKKAITWESGRSTIDQEKCIKCGRCVGVCPYNAIVKTELPAPLPAAWAPSTPMSWAARDRLQQVRVLRPVSGQLPLRCHRRQGPDLPAHSGFNRGDRIYALVAPAFINQFPGLASTGKLKAALKALLLRRRGGRHRCRPVYRG